MSCFASIDWRNSQATIGSVVAFPHFSTNKKPLFDSLLVHSLKLHGFVATPLCDIAL